MLKRQVQREVQQLEMKNVNLLLTAKQRILKELFAGAYEQMAAWSLKQEQAFWSRS